MYTTTTQGGRLAATCQSTEGQDSALLVGTAWQWVVLFAKTLEGHGLIFLFIYFSFKKAIKHSHLGFIEIHFARIFF